ncbi:MAG: toprim domain-containing protein, partial [Defluviitaleaceae bacterium]|nr:toprim domain-containing protein [Defluviitaleaceae bacterium]
MKLIITEKPSVAATMAKFVKANKRHDGYFEGNGYLVSWCLGHLLSLANPGEYDKRYERWNMEDLPIVPRDFGGWKYVVNEDTKAQLANVKALMKRDDVVEIINACDAGREGELIFRVVYNHAKSKKPMKRLWVSSMEEASIRDAFANLKDGTTYDGLYSAAATRQRADWLAGMNLSR